jgi:hypothetical protein
VLWWHVALIVIAAVLFALLVIGLVVLFLRQRNRENNDGATDFAPAAEAPSAGEPQNQAVAPPLPTSEYAAVVLSGAAATPLTANQYGAARGEYGIAPPFTGGDATTSMRVGPSDTSTGTGTYGIAPPFATNNFLVGRNYDVAPHTLTGTGTYGVVEPAETASSPYEATGAPLMR